MKIDFIKMLSWNCSYIRFLQELFLGKWSHENCLYKIVLIKMFFIRIVLINLIFPLASFTILHVWGEGWKKFSEKVTSYFTTFPLWCLCNSVYSRTPLSRHRKGPAIYVEITERRDNRVSLGWKLFSILCNVFVSRDTLYNKFSVLRT